MSELWQDTIGTRRTDDALMLLIGELIGRGEHREVYNCDLLPGHVIKVERTESSGKRIFANVNEFEVWREFEGTRWAKWLAPVTHISENGLILIQKKCEPLRTRPSRIPSFLADVKTSNWGTLNGAPVCFDYGNHKCYDITLKNIKSVIPRWHDLSLTRKPRVAKRRGKKVKPGETK